MSDNVRLGSPEHRLRVIAKLRQWCDDLRQLLLDCEHWNAVNPAEEPIDFPDVRQMLAECEDMLAKDPGHGPIAPSTYVFGREPKRPQ